MLCKCFSINLLERIIELRSLTYRSTDSWRVSASRIRSPALTALDIGWTLVLPASIGERILAAEESPLEASVARVMIREAGIVRDWSVEGIDVPGRLLGLSADVLSTRLNALRKSG